MFDSVWVPILCYVSRVLTSQRVLSYTSAEYIVSDCVTSNKSIKDNNCTRGYV